MDWEALGLIIKLVFAVAFIGLVVFGIVEAVWLLHLLVHYFSQATPPKPNCT